MNIYLISQDENHDFDTFDSMVVVAHNEHEAKFIHPHSQKSWTDADSSYWCASPNDVTANLIGVASPHMIEGVVLRSYNAG